MDRPEAQAGRRPKRDQLQGESFPTVLELAEHLGIQKEGSGGLAEEKWSLPNQKPTIRNIPYKGIVFEISLNFQTTLQSIERS